MRKHELLLAIIMWMAVALAIWMTAKLLADLAIHCSKTTYTEDGPYAEPNRPGLWRVDGGNPNCQMYVRVEYGRHDELEVEMHGRQGSALIRLPIFDWYFITDRGINTLTVAESNSEFEEKLAETR